MEKEYKTFEKKLRDKWRELPGGRMDRIYSESLMSLSDYELLNYWDRCKEQTSVSDIRGWYQTQYRSEFSGKTLLDIGPGIGIDGIYFAGQGSKVTFADIVEENLTLLRNICDLKAIKAEFCYISFHKTYQYFQLVSR